MDRKVALLKSFSRGFTPGAAKIETERCGFAFLESLLAQGARLEYGELTPTRLLHKYKLTDIPERQMDDFLEAHLAKTCNVCRYFGPEANDVFCFNLDNNHQTDNTRVIPEMERAVGALRDCLGDLGVKPLIVASGRGFHVWCRLNGPIENDRLHRFMLRAAIRAMATFHDTALDHRTVKFNFYPDVRAHHVVSLRLFGSEHAKNRVFSRILTPGGLLDEGDSWGAFEDFLRDGILSNAAFSAADETLRHAKGSGPKFLNSARRI